ncbi:MAG: hypothetical protein H6742_16320 [Alphaproteobacteria bacterium]|nr:hypothetical protein [Alphaproteobacteria bacterium]
MSENAGISFVLWGIAWLIGFALLPAYRRAQQRRAREGGGADRERARRWWLWLNSKGTIGLGTVFLVIGLAFAQGDWRAARLQARVDALALTCTTTALSVTNHGREPVGVDVELVQDEELSVYLGGTPDRRHRPHSPQDAVELGPGDDATWALGGDPMCGQAVFLVGTSRPCRTAATVRLSGPGWAQDVVMTCVPEPPQR